MSKIESGSIVVGFDGYADATLAVQWAAEQAALEGRSLVVITAVRPNFGMASSDGTGFATSYPVEDLLDHARVVADEGAELARRHRPTITADGHAVLGDPRQVLSDASTSAHLLVLGSRGRGIVRSKLGSVSAYVSKRATCPVVVCRPGTELKVKHGVLVGADGTSESLPVIEFAFQQAALRSQPLTVVHCYDRGHPDSADGPPEEAELVLAESVAGFRERYPEVYVQLAAVPGHADERLAEIADRHDLVVLGRRPLGATGPHLAAHAATSVLERSHTPVAVVPEAARVGQTTVAP